MFCLVQQAHSKSTAVHWIAAVSMVILFMVLSIGLSEHAVGVDKIARQRFVVEVTGTIRMNSVPVTDTNEMSRVEIASAAEVVLALSSNKESASASDALFLLHSGQACQLSIHRSSGRLGALTVSLSGQTCLQFADESTPVLTITSI